MSQLTTVNCHWSTVNCRLIPKSRTHQGQRHALGRAPMNPEPCITIYYMVNPKPQTSNPKLQTPKPKSPTPNPKLQTPNPKPQTLNQVPMGTTGRGWCIISLMQWFWTSRLSIHEVCHGSERRLVLPGADGDDARRQLAGAGGTSTMRKD